ncbi:hypothetical protein [Nocardioides dongkuii]|uniref:hypothetical protein n=1 Tax=Nocardioides dongkuii TaxID=2760089 RepID=UPI001878DBC5|nr:hypothetical protein [Nocardioides dongkuii]
MTTTRRWSRASAAAALVLALVASACSGDDGDDDEEPGAPASPPAAAAGVETTATIGRVSGSRLPGPRKKQVRDQVTKILDPWIDAAYVGGTWPRSDFDDAFRGFTPGARRDARADLDLMSNADIGERVDSVTATRRRLRLDVLAVAGRAVGVTARVHLAFRTTGEVERRESVRGRLFLTRGEDGWRVFGYDLSAGTVGPRGATNGKNDTRGSTR